MKVTSIKQQVKKTDRYSIFVDGKYAFSLSEAALLESKIVNGQELSKQELKQFKQTSAEDKIYNQLLRYVALRPHSQWEITDYLRRKKVEPETADKLLNKLITIGFVDDEAFAKSWVANRRLLKPVSRRRLIQELSQKRVEGSIVERVLNEDETDEQAVLNDLVARKRRQTKYQDNQKLMQYLARQGFSYSDIKDVLKSD